MFVTKVMGPEEIIVILGKILGGWGKNLGNRKNLKRGLTIIKRKNDLQLR